jgi:hypothetical protein
MPRKGRYSGGYTIVCIPRALHEQLQKVEMHVSVLVAALIEDYLKRIPMEIEKIQEEAAREKWSSLRIAIEINKRVFFKDLSGLLKSLFHKDIPELISK